MRRSGYQIRVFKDGAGYAYEVRDELTRRLVRSGWGIGSKQAAFADARRAVLELARINERRAA